MRVKSGNTRRKRHKKVIKETKGGQMSYGTLFKRSKEAMLHAGEYSKSHRRRRRSQMKQKWIKTINAALSSTDFNYSQFQHALKNADIQLNTKVLAQIAVEYPENFSSLVASLKK